MALSCATTSSAASRLRPEAGFTVVELMLAILLLGISALALGATLSSATKYASSSEVRQDLAHRAQQQVELLSSLDYAALAHSAAPASGSASTSSPLYWYTPSSTRYRWDRTAAGATTAESLVVDAANGTVPISQSWSDGRSSGQLYAFVTWVNDGRCGSGCPSTHNYKRITVAATLTSGGQPVAPVYVSTIVADPHAIPAGRIINGNPNPLADPNITCTDTSGHTTSCTASVGSSNVSEWYMTDTPATSAYAAPTASHTTHPTVAPSGTCTTTTTTGCPKPDLLSPNQPAGASTGPLYDFSTDLSAAGYPGGRLLKRDVSCSSTPTSTDNTKGAMWVTAPLTSSVVLTGGGGMTVNSQTAAGVNAGVTLCVGFYDVPNSLTNLVTSPPTRLGVVAYTVAQWPTAPTPISFTFDFLTGSTATVASGHRLGLRIWATNDSGADIAVLYDHPAYASVVQLNSQ